MCFGAGHGEKDAFLAEDRTRTCTSLRTQVPETCASASFATSAREARFSRARDKRLSLTRNECADEVRSYYMKAAILSTLVMIAVTTVASAAAPVRYLPVPKGAAVILNTGSTNAAGYRIVLQRSGSAEYIWGAQRATSSIDPKLASKFFEDATSGMPLSQLRVVMCMKSASFGTMTFVWWRGSRSRDLSCPGDASAQHLYADALAVASALEIGGGKPVYLPTGEPRKPIPTPSPSRSR